MRRDFTLGVYRRLCEALVDAEYWVWPIVRYLEAEAYPEHFVLLRHDIDRRPGTALRIATLEYELGLRTTYYVRMVPATFRPAIIEQIAALGHEIGFHYETLGKTGGDYERAIALFREELATLRQICEVRTISMHGRSMSPYDSRDLWHRYDYREFGLLGEAYLSIDYSDVAYFTDTGRTWNGRRYNVRDRAPASQYAPQLGSTDELIALIRSRIAHRLCISTHPNRWASGLLEWMGSLLADSAKNIAKRSVLLARQT